MIIGIDASRAFLKNRTGIEEYSYQVIKHLKNKLDGHQVFLYVKKNQEVDFALPENWKIKIIKLPYFWTQIGLSWELWKNPIDVLFIPAHTVSFICPKNTVVTIHGLEYEKIPEAYSYLSKIYMRFFIKRSCRVAKKIIAVSKNTKKDLMELYKVPEGKIEVIYEGVAENFQFPISNFQSISNDKIFNSQSNTKYQIQDTGYLLFIGRLEKRKNVEGIIEAYKILKEKYNILHKLVLAGKPGFEYEYIKSKIDFNGYKNEIIETGYVSEEEKFEFMKNADVFLFPTFYEGFGLPILEAQNLGVPVVTSNISSLPEVGGDSVAYCTPQEPISIASAIYEIINDENFKKSLIEKGYENVKRFSWEKCSVETAEIFMKD